MTDGGLDYARSVLEKAFGETTARNLLEKVSKTLQSKPFNFFTKGDPKSLLALLQHERPQVIALIMSYMDPQQAAQILEQLPNEKRIPVLEGMANMSRVSPEAIAIVEEEMKRKFATIITSEDNMNLGGIDYVADVMNHVDRGNEKQIFDEMDKDNPELSKSIRDKMFMFENIIDMDPRSVQRFIRDCDSKDIVYALMLWSSIFVTLMANKIGGLQFGIYRNCQISSRVFHTAVAALPLTKTNRSDFE